MRSLKKEKEKSLAEKDSKKAAQIRKQIKKLKRQTRLLASEKKQPAKGQSA